MRSSVLFPAGAAAAEERDELARGDRDVESAQHLAVDERPGHVLREDRHVGGRLH
jgi:hypothetical protein